jgi:gliding motility-associated-like protein
VEAPGNYIYTVLGSTPCVDAQATVSVSINEQPDSGANGSIDLCTSSAPTDLFTALGGSPDAGGSWNGPTGPTGATFVPGTNLPGTYTYTLPGTTPCIAATAEVQVLVSDQPSAGSNTVIDLCSSPVQPLVLFDALESSPTANGSWTGPSGQAHGATFTAGTDTPGDYTYTVSATAPCTTATSILTINVVQAPNAGTGSPIAICENSPIADPTVWLSDDPDAGGVWTGPNGQPLTTVDPASAVSGNYTYTVVGTAPCPSDNSVVALTVNTLPDAGSDAVLSGCSDAASTDLFGLLGPQAQSGGSWTGPAGGSSGTFVPGVSPQGTYTYVVPGTAACLGTVDSAVVDVTVFPLPQPLVQVSPSRGCAPLSVEFTSTGVQGQVVASWSFGDGSTSTGYPSTDHLYDTGGSFDVSLSVTDDNGCTASVSIADAVLVSNGPSAAFTASPARIGLDSPVIDVSHDPQADVIYTWTVDDSLIVGGASFSHIVDPPELGPHTICLLATDTLGCSNEECFDFLLEDGLTIHVPNSFTPDGDGLNDLFLPVILNVRDSSYSFTIFDRWGAELFNSSIPGEGWTGAFRNQGEIVAQGVYVWRLTAQDVFTAERKEMIGSVTLLK